MRQLAVYFNDIKAGILSEINPGAGYTFQYNTDYLNSAFPPISVTMPKTAASYQSELLFPVFTNMLPEGGNRRVICRWSKIAEEDYFGLLEVMAGTDFIGAVNIRKINND